MAKTNGSRVSNKTLMLVQLAVLTAIIFIFELTNIGFIPVPPLTLVIMMVPVIIGAVTMGKGAGAFLGLMFGITSMMQCFGKNALGTFLLGINPFYTILLNVGVRVVVGFLTALAFEWFNKLDKGKLWSYAATGLVGSLLNTVLYMSVMVLLFGTMPEVQAAFLPEGSAQVSQLAFLGIAFGVVAVNAVVEGVVCTLLGGTVAKVIDKLTNKR